MKKFLLVLFLTLSPLLVTDVNAQTQIPQPSGPVAFCGVQASPSATSFKLVFDGGAPEDVLVNTPTDTTTLANYCNAQAPAGWTHAFTIAAARFTLRPEPFSVVLQSINAFGETLGVVWNVSIGMKPGQFTITHVGQLPQD